MVDKAKHRKCSGEIKYITSSIDSSNFALSRNDELPKPLYRSGSPLEMLLSSMLVLTVGDY